MNSSAVVLTLGRRAATRATRGRQSNVIQMSNRKMGGGGQPESQSMKAELFGGHEKDTGWETVTYGTYAAATLLLGMIAMAPDTSITTWASGEARARLKLKEEGKIDKLEFGVHYDTDAKFNYESKFPDNPFDEDLDDDDDDDDEDDDDDDEEEEEE